LTVDSQLILQIIKLVLGGFSTLFAILLWSKTREFSILFLVISTMGMYALVVYETLVHLGIIINQKILIFGIPLMQLFFTIVPSVFFLISLILIFIKINKQI